MEKNCYNCIHYIEKYFYGTTAAYCEANQKWCYDCCKECTEFIYLPDDDERETEEGQKAYQEAIEAYEKYLSIKATKEIEKGENWIRRKRK